MTIGTTVRNESTDRSIGLSVAAQDTPSDVLSGLGVSDPRGLSDIEVLHRRAQWGPNAVSTHRARFWPVLWHQLRSPLLALLLSAALASYFVGEKSDAVIIAVIVALSVGLGFVNEYRAERAAEALHDQIHHETVVTRDGRPSTVDVTDLVPGDLVDLRLGDIVPADVRLISVVGLIRLCAASLVARRRSGSAGASIGYGVGGVGRQPHRAAEAEAGQAAPAPRRSQSQSRLPRSAPTRSAAQTAGVGAGEQGSSGYAARHLSRTTNACLLFRQVVAQAGRRCIDLPHHGGGH